MMILVMKVMMITLGDGRSDNDDIVTVIMMMLLMKIDDDHHQVNKTANGESADE